MIYYIHTANRIEEGTIERFHIVVLELESVI